MAFASQAGKVLLFGGADGPGSQRYDDTWEYDGTTWTQRSSATRPAPRSGHTMVYDAARDRCVVFGGITGASVALGDMWEWDGTNWMQRTSPSSPSPRIGHAMAYDAGRGRTVLFSGGLSGNPVMFTDTWEWDGASWLQRTPIVAPPGSDASVMAYDATRARCVLYVPVVVGGALVSAQTWEWDGSLWMQRTPQNTPSPRRIASMAYDSGRQRVVLFGGHYDPTSTFLADTWEWDGAEWHLMAPASHPQGRGQSAMAYDSLRQRIVLFGGALSWGHNEAGDTWEFGTGASASYSVYGTGCAGWAGTPWLSNGGTRPVLGQQLYVSLYNLPPDHATLFGLGWSDTSWQGAALPIDLGFLGAPGCRVLASVDFTWPIFNWAGYGAWSLTIPNQASLIGMRFYNQAASVDHSNALGLVFTNAGAAQIGDL